MEPPTQVMSSNCKKTIFLYVIPIFAVMQKQAHFQNAVKPFATYFNSKTQQKQSLEFSLAYIFANILVLNTKVSSRIGYGRELSSKIVWKKIRIKIDLWENFFTHPEQFRNMHLQWTRFDFFDESGFLGGWKHSFVNTARHFFNF